MKGQAERFKIPEPIGKMFLVVLALLIFNLLVAYLLVPLLDGGTWFFQGKSGVFILSDLFFLEGSFVFALGAFIKLATSSRRPGSPRNPSDQKGVDEKTGVGSVGSSKKCLTLGVLMMIIGACFIVLSIAIGALG